MNSKTLQAKQLLKHYFRLVTKASGVGWDSDNEAEMEQLVDLIVEAAVDEIRAQENEIEEEYRKAQAEAWAKVKARRDAA